jgi:signal transduction histidine kinase
VSIKLRLSLLLGLLLLGFLALLVTLRLIERRELEHMLAEDRQTRAQLLDHWIDFAARALPQFAAETAQSEEFARLVAQPDANTAREKIAAELAAARIDAAWMLEASGRVQLHVEAPGSAGGIAFPLAAAEFTKLVAETPSPRFFAGAGADLVEISLRRVQPANGVARDWLAVARRWDQAQLRSLAELTEAQVALRGPHEPGPLPASDAHIVLTRTLADWQGHPLRTLVFDYEAPEFGRAVQSDWRQAQVFVSFGLLVIVAVGLALQGWVLRPLGRIGTSLAHNDPAPAQAVAAENSELGRVATLVLSSFEQRQALEKEIAARARAQEALERSEDELRRNLEERARLGRDLHDGVIQSLYAAGMGLAGIRAQLRPDQVEAATRLEQTRGALNETIHDVRNFIVGLEPEALKQQTFSQALVALLDTMHGIRPFRSTLSVDETLAMRLTLAQRVHALQITREAVSNALRHGAAQTISVALRTAGTFAEFEIVDDGQGFDPATATERGQGLRNLAQRARELGAEFLVDSQPGAGAHVKLTFSLRDL